MKQIIWLPPSALSAHHPIFKHVTHVDEVVFIWDEALFKANLFCAKRLDLMYQALEEFSGFELRVIEGDTNAVLDYLIEHEQVQIHTPEAIGQSLVRNDLKVYPMPFLVPYPKKMPAGFFPYWNHAKKKLMKA